MEVLSRLPYVSRDIHLDNLLLLNKSGDMVTL